MSEDERTEFLVKELATARPLISPFVTYSAETPRSSILRAWRQTSTGA